jgi:hypothetical protein
LIFVSIILAAFEQTAGPFVKRMSNTSGVFEHVEVAHRLHGRLEIRSRIAAQTMHRDGSRNCRRAAWPGERRRRHALQAENGPDEFLKFR